MLSAQSGRTRARSAAALWTKASFGSMRITSRSSSSSLAAFAPPHPPPSIATDSARASHLRGNTMTTAAQAAVTHRTVGTAARAEAVSKHYGHGETAVTALDRVDVDIERGRFTAIMGPSGSGKSTLMHCLAGLDAVSSGRIFIYGRDGSASELTAMKDKELTNLRRDRIGLIFQALNLL